MMVYMSLHQFICAVGQVVMYCCAVLCAGHKLVVVNMSQQSDSSDLLGGCVGACVCSVCVCVCVCACDGVCM